MLFKHNKLALFLIPKSAAQSTVPFSQLDTFYPSIPHANNTDADTALKEQELPIGVLNSLVKAKRIVYSSTHPNGRHSPTTATLFTPTSPWRGLGPRPAALLAPGAQGAGDQCAPSKLLNERGKQWIADSSNHCIFDSFLTMPIPDSRIKNNASEMLRLMSLCATSSRYGCSCPTVACFLRARRAVGRTTSYYQ
ncbi:hypothetical protein FRC0119_01989 [Corynebacterium diphtheriae]|nr:hypothetical protein FRC0119_01989 [Corynebacterium diphtheriae]